MLEIEDTIGFAVRDPAGRTIGIVEGPLYGSAPDLPDALAIRSGRLFGHHFIVPAGAIERIDPVGSMVDLQLDREQLVRFL